MKTRTLFAARWASFILLASFVSDNAQAQTLRSSTVFAQADSTRIESKTGAAVKPGHRKATRRREASHVHFTAFLSESYDNNPLDYSDSLRAKFKATHDTAQFAISKLSDMVTELGARATFETGRRRSQAWRFRVKGSGTLFSNNSYRNYSYWTTDLRKNFGKSYLELSYSWLPKFNLRNLRWRPMTTRPIARRYAPADFSRQIIGAELGHSFSRVFDARISVDYANTNYKYPFDDRDNTSLTEFVRAGYDASRRLTLNAGLGFTQTKADGRNMGVIFVRDSSYTTPVRSVPSDISNNATLAEIGARLKLNRKGSLILSSNFDYQHQSYSSTKPLDVSHYQRTDNDYEVGFALSWRVKEHWQPELHYDYRKSDSKIPSGNTEFGAYSGYRIGAELNWIL